MRLDFGPDQCEEQVKEQLNVFSEKRENTETIASMIKNMQCLNKDQAEIRGIKIDAYK